VLAPPEVRVIEFGDPLKAWAHKLGLLKDTLKDGAGTTVSEVRAELVQEFKEATTV
jgi:hypothetical protein